MRSGTPPSARPQQHSVLDLSFAVESRYRPFELIATEVGSTARVVGDGLRLAPDGPPAPFCAVEASVDVPSGQVLLGLATHGGDHLLACYDADAGRVGIEHRSGGRTRVVRSRKVGSPHPTRLAFVLCENQVTVLADRGAGWWPVVTERTKVRARVDLRDAGTLRRWHYAHEARGAAGVTDVRWGLFGMTGLRDQHLVQHSDGTPYVEDGKVWFTATCAGLGFFQQAHWAVFSMDLARPERLQREATLFFRRDGLLLGDHAGQVVRDDEQERWILATSSWGDFGSTAVHVRHLVTTVDLLHGVHVLDTEPTALPTDHGSWDPGLTKIDGRWYVSFVESPSQQPFDFHPALAAAPPGADWDEELELVGAATDLRHCEGPVLAQVQGDWWFLASDADTRSYPVFDLSVRQVGRLDAPYETNIPHPQLVPLDDGSFLVVTFDGTPYAGRVMGYGGHGDVLVLRSRGVSTDQPPGGDGHMTSRTTSEDRAHRRGLVTEEA